MATYGWEDIELIRTDGIDMQAAKVIELSIPGFKADVDNFHPAGEEWPDALFGGTKAPTGPLTLKTFYDDTAAYGSFAAFISAGGAIDTYAMIGLRNQALAAKIYMFKAKQSHALDEPKKGERSKLNIEWVVDGELMIGKLVAPPTVFAADGNTESASLDNGTQGSAATVSSSSVANPTVITTAAPHGFTTGDTVLIAGHSGSTPTINGSRVVTVTGASTFTIPVNVTVGGTGGTVIRTSTRLGGYVQLDVANNDLGGHTGLVVKLRHSADNVTFADLATFTTITGLRSAQRIAIESGTIINRYTAISVDFTGSGSPSANIAVALKRS